MNKFVAEIFPGWSSEANYDFSPLGKIWLVWHPSLQVTIISRSLQMISVEVTWPSAPQPKAYISVVYASNDPAERSILWAELLVLAATHDLESKPWLITGDFNQIRDPSEHSSPPTLNMDKRIRELNQCLSDASMDDLNYRGTTFTWWNKQKLSPLAKKLDRVLVNVEWYNMFPSSVAFFGSPHFSDHAVISITLDPNRIRTKKPFKFYNFILQNPDFMETVYESGCIGYHPRTEEIKLTHLMFADDVMVFFDGSSNSLHGISECLDDFASWSGLQMNPTKMELFTSGLDQNETAAINSYGFPSGQLPIRYLGLPLMSRKLKISEYAPLMIKLNASFHACALSLGGMALEHPLSWSIFLENQSLSN
ncbi:hypothetical protein YC2023_001635 [Brassica napus]